MNFISPDQAPYTVCNSPLSEYSVLGETHELARRCMAALTEQKALIELDVMKNSPESSSRVQLLTSEL